jgi:crossover junction endodeoxyribonuclease RuvC
MAARMKGFGPFDHTLASIEQVHAMPGEGAVGAFSFGTGYGIWLGLLAALQVPHQFVTPQAWKKLMLAGGAKEKDAARLKAMQLYPCVADRLTLKKHHGRADALLIAEWARRTDDRNSEA